MMRSAVASSAHRRQAFAQGIVKFLIRLEGRLRANLVFNLADDALGFLVGRVVIQQQLKRRAEWHGGIP